jgi:ferrochelatase
VTTSSAPTAPGATQADPYDALLLVGFGGPEAPEEVMPFLERVTAGRGVPTERLAEVAEHYYHFGGRSPINDQCRALLAGLRGELAKRGVDLPVYWGNRNSEPFLTDVFGQLETDGRTAVVAVLTSAYSSYSGCRQYRENLAAAMPEHHPFTVDRVRHYFNDPGFVAANVDAVRQALGTLPEDREGTRVLFVTHSIPLAMNDTSGPEGGAYVRQHEDTAEAVMAGVQEQERSTAALGWDLVYCSRSGSPAVPWLEPDVNDHLRSLHATGTRQVVLAPIGFISDHMEVAFDLDTEARETADEVGLRLARAATAGTHAAFVSGLVDLVLERAAQRRGEPGSRPVAGDLPPSHLRCPVGCCPNPRGDRPTLTGEDAAA